MPKRSWWHRRPIVVSATAAAALTASMVAFAPQASFASSHREAPLISGQPQLDNTDTYAFVSPDAPDTVTLIANWIPFEEPNGGPNFYPFAEHAAYDINIDNNGAGKPAITYRWWFHNHLRNKNTFLYNTGVVNSLNDANLNFYQTYTLQLITKWGTRTLVEDAPVAPSDTGRASMPNYAALSSAAVIGVPGGLKSFAGQAADPFFLDLRVFDLLYGANFGEVGQNSLKGYNVNTIALQVPKKLLALDQNATRNPVVGIWSTTSRPAEQVFAENGQQHSHGELVQVSRLGNPLVNELVIPLSDKDRFNATAPTGDARFLPFVTDPTVPKLVQAIYGIPAPATPRTDLVEVFLTGVCKACGGPVKADLNSQLLNRDVNPHLFRPAEEMRLNMAVPPSANPNRLGVLGGDLAGYPNGRRLADDVVDVTLQAAEGVLLPGHPPAVNGLGDGVNASPVPFRTAFPYVALPYDAGVNTQH